MASLLFKTVLRVPGPIAVLFFSMATRESGYRRALEAVREKYPDVAEVRVEFGTDHTDAEVAWIWLVLYDRSLLGATRPPILAMEDMARKIALGKKPDLWPYVRVRSESDQREMDVAPTLY